MEINNKNISIGVISMIITNHAYRRYSERTGRDPLECRQQLFYNLEHGQYISRKEVMSYGIRLDNCSNNKIICWFDRVIKEKVFALIREGCVVTIFTEHMYSYSKNKY